MGSLDKERAAMLRALRRKSVKRSTPDEQQKLAREVIDAMPPTAEIKREAERIRERLTDKHGNTHEATP